MKSAYGVFDDKNELKAKSLLPGEFLFRSAHWVVAEWIFHPTFGVFWVSLSWLCLTEGGPSTCCLAWPSKTKSHQRAWTELTQSKWLLYVHISLTSNRLLQAPFHLFRSSVAACSHSSLEHVGAGERVAVGQTRNGRPRHLSQKKAPACEFIETGGCFDPLPDWALLIFVTWNRIALSVCLISKRCGDKSAPLWNRCGMDEIPITTTWCEWDSQHRRYPTTGRYSHTSFSPYSLRSVTNPCAVCGQLYSECLRLTWPARYGKANDHAAWLPLVGFRHYRVLSCFETWKLSKGKTKSCVIDSFTSLRIQPSAVGRFLHVYLPFYDGRALKYSMECIPLIPNRVMSYWDPNKNGWRLKTKLRSIQLLAGVHIVFIVYHTLYRLLLCGLDQEVIWY